ncbi:MULTISPECIES: RidA family protein [unclassified Sphingobium]|uniref:RidA family protein n=1 Tax=unclassified Sphingobium TaxID=2611147 RepID=UPI0035A64AE9
MTEITRIVTNPRRGRAVAVNGLLFLGGQVADDRTVGIHEQTVQALAKIDKILAEAGTDKRRLISVQIWLRDIARDFAAMNTAWDAWIDPEAAPARATCQCEMGAPDVLVEIIAIAALPDDIR